jgi:hypothetical protein
MATVLLDIETNTVILTSSYSEDTYVVCEYTRTCMNPSLIWSERVDVHLVVPSSVDPISTIVATDLRVYHMSDASISSESILPCHPATVGLHLQRPSNTVCTPVQFFIRVPVLSRRISTDSSSAGDYIVTTPRIIAERVAACDAYRCTVCNVVYDSYDKLLIHCIPSSFFQRWQSLHMQSELAGLSAATKT